MRRIPADRLAALLRGDARPRVRMVVVNDAGEETDVTDRLRSVAWSEGLDGLESVTVMLREG